MKTKDKYAKIISKESKKWDNGVPGRVIAGYIFCAIAAVYAAGMLVNVAIQLSYGVFYWPYLIMLGVFVFALCFSILLGVRATRRKNAWKAWRKQQNEAVSAQSVAEPNDEYAISSGDFDRPLREIEGRNIHDIIANAENVEKISLCDENGSYTYDFLWCNAYDGVWYMVVGCNEEEAYMKYILRIDNTDHAVAYFEMNDDIREIIIRDFTAAVEGYVQQKEYTAQSTSGGKSSRFGRLKSRFKSGDGESKKTRVGAFVSVAVMYVVILVAALVLYFAQIPIQSDTSHLLIRAVALGYLLVTPSFLLYLGSHNPFNLKKSISTVFIVLGIVGMVACDVYGILTFIKNDGALSENVVVNFVVTKFIPIALCVSTVAYILVYLVWCRGLSSKWFAAMSYVTTVIFPIATALILAAIALYIAFTLLMWLISAIKIMLGGTPIERGFKRGWTGKGESTGGYQIIDEHGYTRTLTPYEGNRYRNDTGAFWVSDDGGNSFRRD